MTQTEEVIAWLKSREGEAWSRKKHQPVGFNLGFGKMVRDHEHMKLETGDCSPECFEPHRCYTPVSPGTTRIMGGIPYEPNKYPGLEKMSCPA